MAYGRNVASCDPLKIHGHDLKICQMTIFFTHAFTGRYTLHEKSALASPKILLLAKYWVTKSIFSPAVSQKPKTEVVFFLPALTLNWRHSWKSVSTRSFGAALLSNMRDTKCAFWRESGRRAQSRHHPERALQRLIWQNCVMEKVCFLND